MIDSLCREVVIDKISNRAVRLFDASMAAIDNGEADAFAGCQFSPQLRCATRLENGWKKAFGPAALYDFGRSYGPLTGAANHSGTPLPAHSLHETNARLLRRALVFPHSLLAVSQTEGKM